MTGLVAIVGPTAVGKSGLGITIAQRFNGEIVGADSRQIYRYMDIGTAKLSNAERRNIAHHLIDIINPDEIFSVAQYKAAADAIITELLSTAKLPVLVGGSGQYIWSVLENWQIPHISPDVEFRESLYWRAEQEGYQSLHAELNSIDKESALRIQPTNVRRVIRALEIYHQTSHRPSDIVRKGEIKGQILIIGLTSDRRRLYQMIDSRVDDMVRQGLVEEVKDLIDRGYHSGLPSMSGIGYQQITAYLEGHLQFDEVVNRIKYATHRLARSQYNWFRLADHRIMWFDADNDNQEKILYTIKTFLGSS